MISIVTPVCPVTYGRPTRMAEHSFRRMCELQQENEESYCRSVCKGKTLPENLEFIELNQQGDEEMVNVKYTKGNCQVCGREANIKPCLGKQVCSSCDFIWRAVNNKPESILEALIAKMGDQWVQYRLPVVESGIPSSDANEVAELRQDLSDAYDKIRQMDEEFEVQVAINKKAELEITSLRNTQQALSSETVAVADPKRESRDSILFDLALLVMTGDTADIGIGILKLRNLPFTERTI